MLNEDNHTLAEQNNNAEKKTQDSANKKNCQLITLFSVFFKIGMFTFGGGLAMLPLIEKAVVNQKKWMKNKDFIEMLAVVNSLPGAFAINTSIFIGYRQRKLIGAVTAALGTILPSFIVILAVAWLLLQGREMEWLNKFFLGVRPVVVALLIDAGIRIWKSTIKKSVDIILVVIGTLAVAFAGINAAFVILAGAVIGLTWYRRTLLKNQQEVQ
ncbi:MAG: chromate transporter [Bacillota bacterium]|jgi:chromate transporter